MARYKIEATWGEVDGSPVVELEFDRLKRLDDEAAERLISIGHMQAGDRTVWEVLGAQQVKDLPLMTQRRVREAALEWLAEHAGMTPDDSFELYHWLRADRDALGQIEASAGLDGEEHG